MKGRHVLVIEKFYIFDAHFPKLCFDLTVINVADENAVAVGKLL